MNDSLYKGYSAAELDVQYNNRARVADFQRHIDRWQADSEQVRRQYAVTESVSYGAGDREKLDIFPAESAHAPVAVFIHGGYWQTPVDKSYFSFVAPPMLQRGFTGVVLSYPLCPSHRLEDIVRSVRWAMVFLFRNINRHHGDAKEIYVVGHSAGGQLAAMLLATDWSALDSALPRNLVAGAVSISGVFDLEPLKHTSLNAALKLRDSEIEQLSPCRLRPPSPVRLDLLVGAKESDEFKRQSRELERVWSGPDSRIKYSCLLGHDHFSVLQEAASPEGKALTCLVEASRR